MKTPEDPSDELATYSMIGIGFIIIAILFLVLVLSSCAVTRSPDGTWNFGLDGAEAARALIIYSK